MKIKSLLQQVNKDTFIQDYIGACGVDDVQEYLNPKGKYVDDPMGYENIEEGLNILKEVLSMQSVDIYIVQDCDVDGICSAALMYRFLIYIGIHISHINVLWHDDKKHGLSPEIMSELKKHSATWKSKTTPLLIIPDAGTNDAKQCEELINLGCIILILDHHDKETNNPYATVINNQTSSNIHNKSLCGTGVVWKFITAYCKKYLDGDKFYMSLIDLVNFANLADVMDMRSYENRAISRWATNIKNPFLRCLCDEYIKDDNVTPEALVWNIVPKLNAICRLESSDDEFDLKAKIFDAFTIDDIVNEDEFYKEIFRDLNSVYRKQKSTVSKIYDDTISMHETRDDKIEIITIDRTPYTGLVASKLMDYYNKPVLLVHGNKNTFSGSLRSPYPLKSVLNQSNLMLLCQGHEQACGIAWAKNNTDALIEYCNNTEMPEAVFDVCHSYEPHDIPHDIFGMFDEWDYLYAKGVPYPLFHIAPIYITNKDINLIGANKTTIKFTYQGVDYVKFFVTQNDKKKLFVDTLNSNREIPLELEIIGKLQINEWKDKKSEQVLIDRFECRKRIDTFGSIW